MINIPTSTENYEVIHWSGSRLPGYVEDFLLQKVIDKREDEKHFYTYEKIMFFITLFDNNPKINI